MTFVLIPYLLWLLALFAQFPAPHQHCSECDIDNSLPFLNVSYPHLTHASNCIAPHQNTLTQTRIATCDVTHNNASSTAPEETAGFIALDFHSTEASLMSYLIHYVFDLVISICSYPDSYLIYNIFGRED